MTIGLGVFDGVYKVLDTKPCHEFFISLSFELSTVFSENGVREAILAYEVFSGELLYLDGWNFL